MERWSEKWKAVAGRSRGASRKRRAQDLADTYRGIAEALASAIAAKDNHEQHHVKRVRAICTLVAEKMNLGAEEIEAISIAALVHDVGKLGVPEHILLKPGPLDPDEFAKMSNHAAVGAKILDGVQMPMDVAAVVRHHHERYDGTGYPDHLSGEDIPLASRIIAVAEVYDSLVSDRCYRQGWSHQQATEHIEKLSGSHFDPKVVAAMLEAEADIAHIADAESHGPAATASCISEVGDCCAAADVIAQANRELVSLFEIAETLSSTLELDEVLALLAERTRRLADGSTCAVFLLDGSSHTLVERASTGRYQDLLRNARVRLGKGVTGKAASRLKPYTGSYDPNDITFSMNGKLALELKSCMVAPVVSYGQVLGTINVYDTQSNAFSADDLRTLMSVANRAALAIQNAAAFESVRDSAMKDQVTGLYNGRYLRTYLDHEMSRASRHCEPITVLGIDLDNFKAVNDSFGHYRGDIVLRDAAEIFRRQLRDYDLAARNGGDEFVVVLPRTTAHEAARTVDRIRREFDRYAQRALGDSHVALGVSVGVATFPDDGCTTDELLARADAEMYRDKRAHREARKLAA